MRLSNLANKLVVEVNTKPWAIHFNSISVEDILHIIDFEGSINGHLANPLNKNSKVFYFRPRPEPLAGDEKIRGDYLLFDYSSHYQSMKLREFSSRFDIEKFILAGNGIMNNYTSDIVVIIGGEIRHYLVTYFDEDAGIRKPFNKIEQYVGPKPFREYAQMQLHWID